MITISQSELEDTFRMILANKAKGEIEQWNYFKDIIPNKDVEYLKRCCSFDFLSMPNKSADEFTDWWMARNVLSEMDMYIFEIHYGFCQPYSLKYDQHYSMEDRMKAWSDYRHKDDELIESLIDEFLNK